MSSIHTGALNDKALSIYPGDVQIGDNLSVAEDLGALDNLRFETENTVSKIDSDNREKLITKTKQNGKLFFDWKEPKDLKKIANIFKGAVTLFERDGVSAVAVTGEAQTLSKTESMQIRYKNGDNTDVTPTVTTTSGTVLTAGTDYLVTNVNGYTILTLDASYATDTETVTIDYSYTPKKSLELRPSVSGVAKARMGKATAPIEQEDGSVLYYDIEFSSATATSSLLSAFTNVDRTNDVGIMPVELDLGTDWRIVDQYNV